MKTVYRFFYPYTPEEFKEIWSKCIIVLDTNVLLHLYRYTESSKNDLLVGLKKLSSNLWMPYHVGLEFFKGRPIVIREQESKYTEILKLLNDFKNNLQQDEKEKNLIFDSANYKKLISSIDLTLKDLENNKEALSKLLNNDTILIQIENLYKNKIGHKLDEKKIDELKKIAVTRFSQYIPPGFVDYEKKKNEKEINLFKNEFGDYLIWHEILEYCKLKGLNCIFVTDDRKKDWWFLVKNKHVVSPHPMLREEFYNTTNNLFQMYNPKAFLEYANEYINTKFSKTLIDEVNSIENSILKSELPDEQNSTSYKKMITRIKNIRKLLNTEDMNFPDTDDKYLYAFSNENLNDFNEIIDNDNITEDDLNLIE